MQQSVDKTQKLLRLNDSLPQITNSAKDILENTTKPKVQEIVINHEFLPSSIPGAISTNKLNIIEVNQDNNGNNVETQKYNNKQLFLIEFTAGALGGAVSRTV